MEKDAAASFSWGLNMSVSLPFSSVCLAFAVSTTAAGACSSTAILSSSSSLESSESESLLAAPPLSCIAF